MWTETLFSHSAILKYFTLQAISHPFWLSYEYRSWLRVHTIMQEGTEFKILLNLYIEWRRWRENRYNNTSIELYKLYRSVCLEEIHFVRICSSLEEKQFLSAYKSFCEGMHEQYKGKEQTALRYQTVNFYRHQICIVRVSCQTKYKLP